MNPMIMAGTIVALYLRSATGEESRIREQMSELMEVVRCYNLQIVGEYIDVKGNRNAFESMIADVKKKGVKYLLTYDPGRLTRRGMNDLWSIIQRVEGEGAQVYFCEQNCLVPVGIAR